MPIDIIDATILRSLMCNPRTSFKEIAKKCNMSINAIRMRFEGLKKRGVITGSITQINPTAFGYNFIGTVFIQTTHNNEELTSFLENNRNIVLCIRQMGRFNIVAIFSFKTFSELDSFIQQLNFQPSILKHELVIWVDAKILDYPDNLIINPNINNQQVNENRTISNEKHNKKTFKSFGKNVIQKETRNSSYKLDNFDYSILKLLSSNARLSFSEISAKVGLSPQRVIERFHKMEKNEAIALSSITIDLKKIGYVGIAFFNLHVTNQVNSKNVFEKVLETPNIIIAYRALGSFQIFVGTPFENVEQLRKCYSTIASIKGIIEIELFVDKVFPSWPLNIFSKLIPEQVLKVAN